MSEPNQQSSELNEGEKGVREVIVTSGDAAKAFDAAEEIFDAMAATVVAAMERRWLASPTARGDAQARPLATQEGAKDVRIETFVADPALSPPGPHPRPNPLEIPPPAPRHAQRHRAPL